MTISTPAPRRWGPWFIDAILKNEKPQMFREYAETDTCPGEEPEMNGYGCFFRLGCLVSFVLLVIGCGPTGDSTGSAPDLEETWLSEMIRSAPSDTDASYLMFANHQAAREVAGATDFKGLDFTDWSWLENTPWTYEVLPSNPMFDGYTQEAFQTFGVNTLLFDHSIWSEYYNTTNPAFSITTGGLNDPGGLPGRLAETGYRSGTHSGVRYSYFLREDGLPVSSRVIMDHPLRGSLRNLNAVAIIGEKLIVTQEVGELQRLIDVNAGDGVNLWDEESWRVLTQADGDELLAGILIRPEFVGSGLAIETSMIRTPDELREDWERYTVGPDRWGTLMPYTALLIGYGVYDGVERAVVALYHPSPEGAEHNAAELTRRWESAYLDVRRAPLSAKEIPFSEQCSPPETRTEVYSSASVLIASCKVNVDIIPIAVTGARGRDFWQGPIAHHELHFLVPDAAALTGS